MHAQRQGAGRGEEERRERSGHVNLLLESDHISNEGKFSISYSVALECCQKYFQTWIHWSSLTRVVLAMAAITLPYYVNLYAIPSKSESWG